MWDKFYVGLDLTGFENNGIQRPISRVTLRVDDEHVLTAGDDTGFELAADCPHATQSMVNSILAQVKGFQYQMYDASDINIDPAAELGDGITAGGVYSVISRVDDDGSGFPSASAPGEAELEDEYPSGGPMTKEFNRKIAEVHSTISKTAEEIKLQVDDMEDRISSITTSIDNITLSVVNGSTSSTIKLMAGSTVISSGNIEMKGLVTFQGLSDGTTTINGGCIKTGSIESIRINSSTITSGTITGGTISGTSISGGTISGTSVKGEKLQLVNPAGNVAAEIGFSGEISTDTSAVHMNAGSIFLDGQCMVKTTLWIGDFNDLDEAGAIYSYSDYMYIMGRHSRKVALGYEGDEGAGGTFKRLLTVGYDTVTFDSNGSGTVHCYNKLDMHNYALLNSSDARLKTNICPADISALDVIRAMRTYSFDWREDGRHERLGFIAQQLEEDVSGDFVDVSPSDGHYSTKEMKMIPYLVKAVQELSEQIDQLKGEKA